MKLKYIGHAGNDAMLIPIPGSVTGAAIEQDDDGYYDVPADLAQSLLQQHDSWRRAPSAVATPRKPAGKPGGKE